MRALPLALALLVSAALPAPAAASPCTLGVDLASHRDRAPSPCSHYDLGGARALGPIAPGPGAGATLIALDGGGPFAARVTSAGAVTRIPLPRTVGTVRGLARAGDGTHWFTSGDLVGRIGLDGAVGLYRVPATTTGGIAQGPDGAMWFTASRAIGRIDGGGAARVFPLPVHPAGGIASGPGGALWFSAGSHVGRLTTGGALALFALPAGLSATGAVAGAGDGRLWFVDGRHHRLGRIGSGGQAVDFGLPGRPFGIVRGPDPATVWTTLRRSNGQNWIARMTVRGFSSRRPRGIRCDAFIRPACWFDYPHVPAGTLMPLNALAPTGGVTLGPDRRIWFTEGGRVGAVIPFRGVRVCARPPSTSDLIGIRCTHPAVPSFRLTHSGAPYVELTCPRYTLRFCAGTVDLRVAGSGEFLGRGHYVLHPNDNPRVRVKLTGHGVSLVRRRGRLAADATMNAHDGGGLRRVIHARIALVPPR
jgi:virginiamycin B lyase